MLDIPFLSHCAIERVERSAEGAIFSVEVTPELTNSREAAHGGLLMTLLDVTLGHAVVGATPDATSFATIQLNTDFILPAKGKLIATARLTGAGRATAFARGEVTNSEGEIVATASGVFKIIR